MRSRRRREIESPLINESSELPCFPPHGECLLENRADNEESRAACGERKRQTVNHTEPLDSAMTELHPYHTS